MGGHFELESGAHCKLELGGQYDWNLHSIDKYFDKFFNLQKTAFEIVKYQNSKNNFLEEYLTILPNLYDLNEFDYKRYKENIQSLLTIASNNGFVYMKD